MPPSLFSIGALVDKVDFPHYLAAAEDSAFSSAVLEAVKSGAGATLDACTTGIWQNYMVYEDSTGEAVLGYPVYIVSGSSAPFVCAVMYGSWDHP